MGEFSILTIKLLFLFLPGIVYCLVYDMITFHQKKEFNYFIIHSFIFGVISYFIYGVITFIKEQSFNEIHFLKDLLNNNAKLHINEIFYATIIGFVLSIFIAWLKNQSVFKNILNKDFYKNFYNIERKNIDKWILKFSMPIISINFKNILNFLNPFKVCQGDVWNNIFNSNDDDTKWVTIEDHFLKQKYEGWVYKYSDTYKENELFLKDVIIYDEQGHEVKRTPGLYIARKPEEITIEFFAIKPTELIYRYKKEDKHAKQQSKQQSES